MRNLTRCFEDLRRGLSLIVGRGSVKAVDDGTSPQRLQIELLKDEIRDELCRIQNYGFTSVPQPGAEAVVLFPGGDRGDGLIIAVDDRRYRLKALKKGEVALYSDEGDHIVLKRGNIISVTTKTFEVTCEDFSVATKALTMKCATAAIKNSSGEIIEILADLVTALMKASIGQVVLTCPELPNILLKLKSFRGSHDE